MEPETAFELSVDGNIWPTSMMEALDQMRTENIMCDVYLSSTEGTSLAAHSAILSAGSELFRKILQQTKTGGGNNLVIKLSKPASLLSQVLDFLYRGKVVILQQEMEELRQMAETYGIPMLASLCSTRLKKIKFGSGESQIHLMQVEVGDEYDCDEDGAGGDLTAEFVAEEPEGANVSVDTSGSSTLPQVEGIRYVNEVPSKKDYVGCVKQYRYRCDLCGKDFSSLSRLRGHQATHVGKKMHECDICGAGFIQIEYLREHRSIHTGERPHKCNKCDRSFRILRQLKKHMKTHEAVKPFNCEFCDASFRRSDHYKDHMRIHTGERPYVCEICNKKFIAAETLKRHRLVHTDDKPFVCEECGTSFKRKANLGEHRKIHTGQRPFECELCHSRFVQKGHLKKHQETVHDMIMYFCL